MSSCFSPSCVVQPPLRSRSIPGSDPTWYFPLCLQHLQGSSLLISLELGPHLSSVLQPPQPRTMSRTINVYSVIPTLCLSLNSPPLPQIPFSLCSVILIFLLSPKITLKPHPLGNTLPSLLS